MTIPTLEIATDCPEFAARVSAPVDRFEVCHDLEEEGWTPTVELMSRFVEALGGRIELHALIRPPAERAGGPPVLEDFVLDEGLLERSLEAIDRVGALGFQGVVIGPCTAKGGVDLAAARAFCERAGRHRMEVGFHRAFDLLRDPRHALTQLLELGVRRVLSSGVAGWDVASIPISRRVQVLRALREHADQDGLAGSVAPIRIVACGGVRAGNASKFLGATGHVHASCRREGHPDVREADQLGELVALEGRRDSSTDHHLA